MSKLWLEKKFERKISVDERADGPLDGGTPVESMTDPAQVKSDESFNGVDHHAQDEEGLDGHRIADGYVVQEESDGSEAHVGEQVREKRHDLKLCHKYFLTITHTYTMFAYRWRGKSFIIFLLLHGDANNFHIDGSIS